MGFVHLRVHSAYSLSEGAIKLEKLPALATKAGMPAVALTDTNNLFGALEFSTACVKAGVQPILGIELALAVDPAGLEVAPAAVVRDLQVGKTRARQRRDARRDLVEPAAVEAEVLRAPCVDGRRDRAAARADRRRRTQLRDRRPDGLVTQARALSRPPVAPRRAPRRR